MPRYLTLFKYTFFGPEYRTQKKAPRLAIEIAGRTFLFF
jgi:hypothetical protein